LTNNHEFTHESYRKTLRRLLKDDALRGRRTETPFVPKFTMTPLIGQDAYVFKQRELEIELSIPKVSKQFENIELGIVMDKAWCLGVWTILVQKGFQIPPNVEDEFKAIIYGQ